MFNFLFLCMNCKSESFTKINSDPDFYECEKCNLVFQAKPPNTLSNFYSLPNYDHVREQHKGPTAWNRFHHDYAVANKRLNLIKPYLPQKEKQLDFLDVGCSTGSLVYAASEFGFNSTGIELDSQFAKEASQITGLDIISAQSFEELKNKSYVTYNVITAFDVLEHVLTPVFWLVKLISCLEKSGILVLEVPDYDLADSPICKWKHFKPDEHLFAWGKRSINALYNIHFRSVCNFLHQEEPIPGKLLFIFERK